jgi:ribosomal protein S18 acetylase RimI-like enzyme
MSFLCRSACVADAAQCAPLVFASGEAEFGYMLGVGRDECTAFLERAFRSRGGRFSYRRHRVALNTHGEVCSVMAIHEGGRIALDDAVFVWHVCRYFGLARAIGILLRGSRLATEVPPPARGQKLIAHCATRPEWRGRGALSALFDTVLGTADERTDDASQFVLDVRVENVRARVLYRRLGFEAITMKRSRHPRLPATLASERMGLSR